MRWQFIRFYVGFVFVLLLAALTFYFFVRRDYENSVDQRIEQFMTPAVSRIRDTLQDMEDENRATRLEALEEMDRASRASRGRGGRRSHRPFPRRIVSPDELSLSSNDRQRLEEGEVIVIREQDARLVYASVPGGDIVVFGPLQDRERDPDRVGSIFVYLAPPFAILMVIGVTIYLLIRPIERRISSLADVTKSFGKGALSSRAQVGGTDSISDLEESFNAMAARIEHLVDGQKELLRAVSHDLRTPLARVFFALDDAQSEASPEGKNRHLKRIDRSMVELNDLVDELLTFMHLDEAAKEPRIEPVDLSPILQDAAELVSELPQEIMLEVSCDPRRINADPRYLKRAIMNLVTNAVAHATRSVWISCRVVDDSFLFSVDDDGPGIPEAEREKVFEPFYRRDESRNEKLGGSGLGLAIVKRIMSWHNGHVRVTESAHGGARFTLCFPGPGPA
jgi:two-component system sensor histidine kinase RstB